MRALLDVNVLVAILDSNHTFHARAHSWLKAEKKIAWASCPLTENGVLRIMSNPGYDPVRKHSLQQLAAQLRIFIEKTDHEFWEDKLSMLNDSVFALDYTYSYRHLTDSYLLALATVNQGCFVTFDQSIILSWVKGATADKLKMI